MTAAPPAVSDPAMMDDTFDFVAASAQESALPEESTDEADTPELPSLVSLPDIRDDQSVLWQGDPFFRPRPGKHLPLGVLLGISWRNSAKAIPITLDLTNFPCSPEPGASKLHLVEVDVDLPDVDPAGTVFSHDYLIDEMSSRLCVCVHLGSRQCSPILSKQPLDGEGGDCSFSPMDTGDEDIVEGLNIFEAMSDGTATPPLSDTAGTTWSRTSSTLLSSSATSTLSDGEAYMSDVPTISTLSTLDDLIAQQTTSPQPASLGGSSSSTAGDPPAPKVWKGKERAVELPRPQARRYRAPAVKRPSPADSEEEFDELATPPSTPPPPKKKRTRLPKKAATYREDDDDDDDDDANEGPSRRPRKKGTKSAAVKRHPCPVSWCKETFTRPNDVTRHLKNAAVHRDPADAALRRCAICGEELAREDSKVRHENSKACGKRKKRKNPEEKKPDGAP